jgi:hypothetical protein
MSGLGRLLVRDDDDRPQSQEVGRAPTSTTSTTCRSTDKHNKAVISGHTHKTCIAINNLLSHVDEIDDKDTNIVSEYCKNC